MPNRMLREGIVASPRIARLSWPAEVFYRRLMSVVDDYGRYYGSPMPIRAACYPLQLDRVRDSHITQWLAECVSAGLVKLYDCGGSTYVEMLDFRQQIRAKKSKFPDPVNGAEHPIGTSAAPATQETERIELPDWIDRDQWAAWVKIRPGRARSGEALRGALAKLERWRAAGHDANAIVADSLSNGWQGLFAPKSNSNSASRPEPGSAPRPSIKCSACGTIAYTWTGTQCDPCWRKSQGFEPRQQLDANRRST